MACKDLWKPLAQHHSPNPCLSPLCFLQRPKKFTANLKSIYKAPTEELALAAIFVGREILVSQLVRTGHHVQISAGNSQIELRHNAIGNFNRQLRKVTKTKSAFVSDDALIKLLYLTTMVHFSTMQYF